jgi:hypothetical protein
VLLELPVQRSGAVQLLVDPSYPRLWKNSTTGAVVVQRAYLDQEPELVEEPEETASN